ncbi:hypothetical protein OIU91_04420 [Streptomyces sp. NBC_01456]|uniref:hypothetical protein n=1 Tax=unclassified Streptomyces TaxID=2593676 RepID=UPI002E35A466|nr:MULTISPECIES: hypothetical protein [unclassified Streptomyces]
MSHPLQPGDRVYHGSQIWARSLPGGTGEVLRVEGPDHRGDYEYLVRCGQDFSRRTGADNPETCERLWSSYHTNRAKES